MTLLKITCKFCQLITAVLCGIFFTASSSAQVYNFHNYNVEQGLVQSRVNALTQDKNGFLWIATDGGLSKFDGKDFMNFTAKDGLSSNRILNVFSDSENRIWASGMYGISCVSGKSIRSYSDSDGINVREIKAIAEFGNRIWFGGKDGLLHFDGTKFTSVVLPKKFQQTMVQALYASNEGILYIGFSDGKGVLTFDGKNWNELRNGLIKNETQSGSDVQVICGNDSLVLFLTSNSIFELKKGKITNKVFSGIYLGVEAASIDKHNTLWLATQNGMAFLEQNKLTYLTENNGMSSSEVYAILCDKDNGIWCGGRKGLSYLSNRLFVHYAGKQQISKLSPSCIHESLDGKIWFNAEPNGLFIFENELFTEAQFPNGLTELFFSCIQSDTNGNIWLGTGDFNGIFRVKGKQINHYTTENGLPHNNISVMLALPNSKILAGTSRGLAIFENENWQTINPPQNIIQFDISALHNDRNGRIWIGTTDGKLFTLDQDSKIQEAPFQTNFRSAVIGISSSENGVVFATESEGIAIFANNRLKKFSKESGLKTNEFRFVVFGTDSKLYGGTQKGLLQLELNKSFDVIGQKLFGQNEGFVSGECNKGAVFKSSDSKIWIGTPSGVTVLSQKHLQTQASAPDISIGSVLLFFNEPDWGRFTKLVDKSTGFGLDPVFPYYENYLSFTFKGIQFSNSNGITYKWKLDGLESEWTPKKASNEAIYSSLPPNKYVFRVKAISAEGVESEERTFRFEITPPFWQTHLFYAMVIVGLLALGFAYIRYREENLIKEKERLEEAVTMRTLELQEQKNIVEQKNQDLMENILYARNIQNAILPGNEEISKSFTDFFVLFKPQNVISGDLFWHHRHGKIVWIAAVDCTGHGVPGAFMSMMANDLLNQAVIEKNISSPGKVLADLNRGIRLIFRDENRVVETQQGMDLALIKVDTESGLCVFSGAMRPLTGFLNGQLQEWEGDKASIGRYTDELFEFTEININLSSGDSLFMYSDGYCDQFGGPKGKKFMVARFKDILITNIHKSMPEIGHKLDEELVAWQGELDQVDDILVLGLRF